MTRSTTYSVQQQRHDRTDEVNFYPTPPWGSRALCAHVLGPEDWAGKIAWDPACGAGHMVRPLREYFRRVIGSDLHRYGADHRVRDFLSAEQPPSLDLTRTWIITNPPFTLATAFVPVPGAALLVRIGFMENRRTWVVRDGSIADAQRPVPAGCDHGHGLLLGGVAETLFRSDQMGHDPEHGTLRT